MSIINGLPESKSKWKISYATMSQVWNVFANLREEDKAEIEHSTNESYIENWARLAVAADKHLVYKLTYRRNIIGLGGLFMLNERMHIFLVFTKEYEKYKLSFLKFSRQYLPTLLKAYGTLRNYVWLKNTGHVEYLKWLGAKFTPVNEEFALFVLGDETECVGGQSQHK